MHERDHSQFRADMQGRFTTGPQQLDVTTMSRDSLPDNFIVRGIRIAGSALSRE